MNQPTRLCILVFFVVKKHNLKGASAMYDFLTRAFVYFMVCCVLFIIVKITNKDMSDELEGEPKVPEIILGMAVISLIPYFRVFVAVLIAINALLPTVLRMIGKVYENWIIYSKD